MSRNLITRIRKRDLFTLAVEHIVDPSNQTLIKLINQKPSNEVILNQIISFKNSTNEITTTATSEGGSFPSPRRYDIPDTDIFCRVYKISVGNGNRNPVIDGIRFYKPLKTETNNSNDIVYEVGETQTGM